jgi:histidinol dehydrogenase
MCVGPARVAGVKEIALCVPPNKEGSIDDVTLAAAAVAGVQEIYAVGGAQAIAAMALGTETIERVDVIVGPGNSYVAEAKRQLSGTVGVASAFAGPSEIVVIADGSTPPDLAAIDLMVQAEHGPDGMAWLITWDEGVAAAVERSLEELVESSPRRADLTSTMERSGVCVLVDGPEAAVAVSNLVAPEHLELLVEDYRGLLESVRAAGAVFCGVNAPASLGDYAVGPNHILPTNRSARFSSALRADDFSRHIHVVEVRPSGFDRLAPTVMRLAQAEGLPAHVDSIRLRRERT